MRPVCLAFCVLTIPVAAAPPEVAVVRPVVREITDYAEFSGRVEPSALVQLRSREVGLLEKVLFKEGAEVKKGDLLFQVDDRLPRAELAKVEAEVARAEAELRIAEVELKRLTALAGAKAVGQEELDGARAAVEKGRAGIAAAKAALELARVRVEYTRIAAPIAGRIGRVSVDPGNIVSPDIVLATLTATDPVRVAFGMDERTFLRLRRSLLEKRTADELVSVEIAFRDGEGFSAKGSVDLAMAAIDPKTGTVAVRANLANPGNRIVSGQFAQVRAALGLRPALFVPETAVTLVKRGGETEEDGFWANAWLLVLDEKGQLDGKRRVRAGEARDGMRIIEGGLTETDAVVRDVSEVTKRNGDDPIQLRLLPAEKKADPAPALTPRAAPSKPIPEFPTAGPSLIVTASYPGASSAVVEETVAAPIDKQLEGLEGLVSRVHVCTDDGGLRMTLTFKPGTDLNKAGIEAHKRVARAEPTLPDLVRRQRVILSKRMTHLMAIAITSPKGTYDRQFMTEYAVKRLRDDVARVSGIGDATLFGADGPETSVRLLLDPDKLAAFKLTAADVTNALRAQNLSVLAAREVEGVPTLTLGGRVAAVEDLGKIVLRADKDGRMIPLNTVARIEQVAGRPTLTVVDGQPAAILLISRTHDANPTDTDKAVRRWLEEMRKQFPVGLEAKVIGD
jgi:membrane fusion protein, multidrug efflux system